MKIVTQKQRYFTKKRSLTIILIISFDLGKHILIFVSDEENGAPRMRDLKKWWLSRVSY